VRHDDEVGRRLEDVASVVAALARTAGTVLDPYLILTRTVAALEPVVELSRVSLWRTTRDGVELVATHPSADRELSTLGLEAESALEGTLSLPLQGRAQPLGHLVAHTASGEPFTRDEEALLDIAASQVAGALERAQLFAEVMELERLKSDFIARVSHELRTPITIISGFLETLIAHDDRLDAEQRVHMLERSQAASARLGDLIEELLILSRIEGGVLTPQPEAVVTAELLDTVRAAAAEPDQVIIMGGNGNPEVVADPALLARALGLLVDNAVKYGGVAELTARTEGDRWIVEVRDRGPGFPDDVRDTAFEMFTRSQGSSTTPGLGAGLAIARTIVEVLDGTISIDDHPGPGALVRVTLPG
jgi:signal transduction histidine kinase